MRIEVISYSKKIDTKDRPKLLVEIINRSEADLIVFSGGPLKKKGDVSYLQSHIDNKHSDVFFDVKFPDKKYYLYKLHRGKVTDMKGSRQIFVSSGDLKEKPERAETLLKEMKHCRIHKLSNGLKVLVLLCGENNIVKNCNPKTPEHEVHFRLKDEKLKTEFEKILSSADIIVNPTHSMNSRPWLYEKRAEFFSGDGRVYCFSAEGNSFDSEYLQYVYRNGRQLKGRMSVRDFEGERYCRRVFDIEVA